MCAPFVATQTKGLDPFEQFDPNSVFDAGNMTIEANQILLVTQPSAGDFT